MYTAKLLILQALSVSAVVQTGKDTKNLLKKLIKTDEYDKRVRPRIDQGYTVSVGISFALKSVIEFDEQKETLRTNGFLHVVWFDEYLKWNPSDYDHISHVYLPQDEIWTPDLGLRNSIDTFTSIGSADTKVKVLSDGFVSWNLLQVLQSECLMNIAYFPFDSQTCDLIFTSLSYTNSEVQLVNFTLGDINLEFYHHNSVWNLVSTNLNIDNQQTHSGIFSLTLKRRPIFYLINIIIPVLLLSFLNTFTFLLPVESGERAQFSVTIYLSLAVFLTIVSDKLPTTVSLMAIYLTMMTSMSTFITVACLAQIRLSVRKESEQRVTGCYAAMVKLASCCGSSKMGNNLYSMTWCDVIHATDFIFFWLSCVYTLVITGLFAYSAFAES